MDVVLYVMYMYVYCMYIQYVHISVAVFLLCFVYLPAAVHKPTCMFFLTANTMCCQYTLYTCKHTLISIAHDITYLDPFLGARTGSLYITDYKMYFKCPSDEKSVSFPFLLTSQTHPKRFCMYVVCNIIHTCYHEVS